MFFAAVFWANFFAFWWDMKRRLHTVYEKKKKKDFSSGT
jgi:hypothetical protein